MTLERFQATFETEDGIFTIDIIHNFPKEMPIEDALEEWAMQTEDYSSTSFVEYINGTKTSLMAYEYSEPHNN